MKYITSESKNMFDGPFKVPLPRKTSAFTSHRRAGKAGLQAPKAQYKGVDGRYSSFTYQKLLGKLLQNPEEMTKYDMKVLSTHPVIRRLLRTSREGSLTNTHFYVPIDSLLNPELYKNSHVPVIIESPAGENQSESPKQNGFTESLENDSADDTTNSATDSDDAQEVSEPRVGFYTQKERQQKILRYRQKLQRYREGKCSTNQKAKRKYNRLLSKTQPRKNGRFASYPDVTDSILEEIQSAEVSTSTLGGEQCAHSYVSTEGKDLNDMVSEITGIF